MSTAPRHRKPAGLSPIWDALESLEPRALLSAYTFQSFAEMLGVTTPLVSLAPPSGVAQDHFGAAATLTGDLDGDGVSDLAIAAPGHAPADSQAALAGNVFIYSGASGTLIRTLTDGAGGFGSSIVDIGDINGDGKHDLAVGSPLIDLNDNGIIQQFGRVYIYSGADGTILRRYDGVGGADQLGFSIADAGDLTGDGKDDLIIGAPGAGTHGEGRVYVRSTADAFTGPITGGPLLATLSGEATGDRFGESVAGGRDMPVAPTNTLDGVPDFVVGAPFNDHADDNAGRVYLYNGQT